MAIQRQRRLLLLRLLRKLVERHAAEQLRRFEQRQLQLIVAAPQRVERIGPTATLVGIIERHVVGQCAAIERSAQFQFGQHNQQRQSLWFGTAQFVFIRPQRIVVRWRRFLGTAGRQLVGR